MIRRQILGKIKEVFYSKRLKKQFDNFHKFQTKVPPQKVIYTCITGDYDSLILNTYLDPNYKYVCFTDNISYLKKGIVGPWHIEPLHFQQSDNTRNNRYHKLHPHLLFPQYEESLFIDANIQLRGKLLFETADKLHNDTNVFLAIPPHRRRKCIYDELELCISLGKDDEDTLLKHRAFLEQEKYPRQMGLTENNVIYRKHMDPRCIKIMEDWWYMVENYSRRDQLSLFYVLWKNGKHMTYLFDFPIKDNKDNFRLFHHNKQPKHSSFKSGRKLQK